MSRIRSLWTNPTFAPHLQRRPPPTPPHSNAPDTTGLDAERAAAIAEAQQRAMLQQFDNTMAPNDFARMMQFNAEQAAAQAALAARGMVIPGGSAYPYVDPQYPQVPVQPRSPYDEIPVEPYLPDAPNFPEPPYVPREIEFPNQLRPTPSDIQTHVDAHDRQHDRQVEYLTGETLVGADGSVTQRGSVVSVNRDGESGELLTGEITEGENGVSVRGAIARLRSNGQTDTIGEVELSSDRAAVVGVRREIDFAEATDLLPNGVVARADIAVATASAELRITDDGLAVGAQANYIEGSITVGTQNANSDRDETVRLGLSAGGGAAARVHWGDADNDGNPEYGIGGDFGIVSFDLKTEDPLRTAAELVAGQLMPGGAAIVRALDDGSNLTNEAGEVLDRGADAIRGLGDGRVGRAADYVERTADAAGDFIEERVDRAGDFVEERVDRAGDFVEERVDRAGDFIEERVDRAGDFIEERVDQAGDIIEERVDQAGDIIEEHVDRAGDFIEERVDRAGDIIEEHVDRAGDFIEERVDRAGDFIEERVDRAGEAIAETVDNAGEAVGEAVDNAGETVAETVDAVGDAIASVFD